MGIESAAPPIPPRDPNHSTDALAQDVRGFHNQPVDMSQYQKPPQRNSRLIEEDIDADPRHLDPQVHFTRDLHRLVAYLVPFPKPEISGVPAESIPQRFLIYTPPPPPFLRKPTQGEKKETITHRGKRIWLKELREAKTRTSLKGKKKNVFRRAKWKTTRGIDWSIRAIKSTNLEFLNRVASVQDAADEHAEDVYSKTKSPEEILLVYPDDMPPQDVERLREEFVATLMRTKKRAERDSIIAGALFLPAVAVDTLAVPIWPFGGLAEIDFVWLYASVRGAKTSRSVTKRLTKQKNKLTLDFAPSPQLDVLERYLGSYLHKREPMLFPYYTSPPSETQVLEAIGWSHTDKDQDHKDREMSFEDEQWEIRQVKDDLKSLFNKGAKEWCRWCKTYRKQPEKALRK